MEIDIHPLTRPSQAHSTKGGLEACTPTTMFLKVHAQRLFLNWQAGFWE